MTATHPTRHRPAPTSWRAWGLRVVSLIVVAAVGLGVYAAWRQTETQACLNESFARSLDERGKATDDLVTALFRLNARLQAGDDERAELDARRAFAADVEQVADTRQAAQSSTEKDQESRCD